MANSINRAGRAILARCLDTLAHGLTRVLPIYVREPHRVKYFPIWEEHGFRLSPVHFYEPIPDTRDLDESLWKYESGLVGIEMREANQVDLLRNVFAPYADEYADIPREAPADPRGYFLNNPFFTGADALVYYGMIRHFKPQLIIEVGSGFSSRLAAMACQRNGGGELVCIEPNPDRVLRDGFPGLSTLIAQRVEEIEVDLFRRLQASDILFVDSSHVVKCGGDVNRLLLEIVPRLNPGVMIHLHDIFLPQEYLRSWIVERRRFFSEQYLLQAFLAFNAEFEVLFANRYMLLRHQEEMEALFPIASPLGSTSFWMRRRMSQDGA